jgi:hypothetical protein
VVEALAGCRGWGRGRWAGGVEAVGGSHTVLAG